MRKLTVSVGLLNVTSLITLGILAAEVAMKSGSESIKNSPIVKTLLEVSTRLHDAINRKSYSKLSKKVKELDRRRDKVYIGVRTHIISMLYSLDDENVLSASRLFEVLEKHGVGIEKMPFLQESTMLRKLVKEFKSPELAADVARIGLTPRLAELELAMADFDEAFTSRTADQAAIEDQLSVTSQRRELEEAIRNFLALANVMAVNEPEWQELVKVLRPDIERIKESITKPEKEEQEPKE